jgi:hypothetical protein
VEAHISRSLEANAVFPSPDWRQLIHAEYTQMPGLALTLAQAQRLWGLDHGTCEAVLEDLRQSGALRLGRDGRYRLVRES